MVRRGEQSHEKTRNAGPRETREEEEEEEEEEEGRWVV